MCAFKMHKLLSNSVNKLKYLNFKNLITENTVRNGVNYHGFEAASVSYSTKQNRQSRTNSMINFKDIITTRRAQAQKSFLIQVSSEKSFSELQKYCCQHGTIIGAHHFTIKNHQFILVEFSNELEAKEVLKHSTFHDPSGLNVESPFLWFRAAKNGTAVKDCKISGELMVTDGCQPIDYNEINEVMQSAENLADQMVILYKSTALNDIGIRLRFLAARQIENAIHSIFPRAQVHIFGSSVNGYGKLGCDLDMVLRFSDSQCDTTQRLVFQTKQMLTNSRMQWQRSLDNFSDIISMYLPGVANVRKILQARVPIARYYHDYLDLDVDLSMNNMSGVYMSEILYMFTQIDERVSPLVFSIRRWAQTANVTNSHAGYWISNFSLTCLVIFYLQQLSEPVLPSVNSLINQARPQDRQNSEEDGLQSTFLRDLTLLKFTTQNTDTLDRLLIGFFEFYSKMNFSEKSISLNDAKLHVKSDHSAMHIINPLEQSLNVSKNVSYQECERFCIEVRNAAWLLESSENYGWGLTNLFVSQNTNVIKPTMFFKSRMVNLKEVFDDTVITDDDSKENVKNIKFKNNSVKDVVSKIQKQRRIELNALKSGGRKR